MTALLDVRSLRKSYGDFTAVDAIDIVVRPGEIVGLLGSNGAGKTTILECIEGLRRPDSGEIRIEGGRSVLGVQLQSDSLPGTMTSAEAMRFFCAYHGIAPRMDLLDRFGLSTRKTARYDDLSVGNRRRLALALAMAHRPKLLLLDEPTAGLDVGSRTELHAVMRELADGGTGILLATHDMAEAEKMADRVMIILGGRVAAEGTPREITAASGSTTRITVETETRMFGTGTFELPAASLLRADERYAVYVSRDATETVSALLGAVKANGDRLVDLRVERPSLEERFVEITSSANYAQPTCPDHAA